MRTTHTANLDTIDETHTHVSCDDCGYRALVTVEHEDDDGNLIGLDIETYDRGDKTARHPFMVPGCEPRHRSCQL